MNQNIKPGTRIELTYMGKDPAPIDVGTKGTVVGGANCTKGQYQVWVKWDNGRTLNLICPEDKFIVLPS